MSVFLSKSQFIRGLQCHKSLWLYKNKPELRSLPDNLRQAIFDTGTEIGLYARGLFPGGKEIKFEGSTFEQKIEQTQKLIDSGVETIYEATIRCNSILVMADILHKGPEGWEIYEVKGSAGYKEVYLNDLAVQYFVLTESGLPVSKACLVYLNNQYVKAGEINIHELFHIHDLTEQVKEKQRYVNEELTRIKSMLNKDCPDIDIGPYCSSPYDCDFMDHCWMHIPDNSIFDLRGRGIDKFEHYYRGIVSLSDLDPDDLNLKQGIQVDAELNEKTIINVKGIKEFLDILHYPRYFLDFETFMPPIPLFDGTCPYQPVPFQYSLHILESENAELKHREFLAEGGVDPREKIIMDLTTLIPDNACIIAYNSSYEKGRIKELAEQFPKYADKSIRICDNMVDLMAPFRQRHYYCRDMKGSCSIKYVLPALVPELSYKGMSIGDGSAAMYIYSALHLIRDKEEVNKIRQALLEYCKLDTYGMVKLLDKLQELSQTA